MDTLIQTTLELCRRQFAAVVAIRRDLHRHPEIGFAVERTAEIVASEMEKLGLEVRRGVGKTGVVADLNTPNATRRIALRADMDALPMQELGEPEYRSTVDGKAHMCGHDAHTAMLIGAARIIVALRGQLKVNIRFVFQPNEENYPGGALAMIADGVLDGVDEIYGQHVWPLYPVGCYGMAQGPFLAQADHFKVIIQGKGGHAAAPHLTIDPIIMGSQFVTSAQAIVARYVNPLDSALLSITLFQAGSTNNVIPPDALLEGTVRTLKPTTQQTIRHQFEGLLKGITAAYGGDYELLYQESCPVTLNHDAPLSRALAAAKSLTRDDQVIYPHPPIMVSEDFGYYSQKIPACFVVLGVGNAERGITRMCHDPRFDLDEEALIYGMALHVRLALDAG